MFKILLNTMNLVWDACVQYNYHKIPAKLWLFLSFSNLISLELTACSRFLKKITRENLLECHLTNDGSLIFKKKFQIFLNDPFPPYKNCMNPQILVKQFPTTCTIPEIFGQYLYYQQLIVDQAARGETLTTRPRG